MIYRSLYFDELYFLINRRKGDYQAHYVVSGVVAIVLMIAPIFFKDTANFGLAIMICWIIAAISGLYAATIQNWTIPNLTAMQDMLAAYDKIVKDLIEKATKDSALYQEYMIIMFIFNPIWKYFYIVWNLAFKIDHLPTHWAFKGYHLPFFLGCFFIFFFGDFTFNDFDFNFWSFFVFHFEVSLQINLSYFSLGFFIFVK